MQKEVILLFNIFSNTLDHLINSFDKKDSIYYCYTKNASSIWLPTIGKNNVAGYFKIKKKASKRNKIINHSKINKKIIEKNKITDHFKIEKEIENINKDMSKINFFY